MSDGKYFVLEIGYRKARVAPMSTYEVFKSGLGTDYLINHSCHCLDVSKEEAHVLLKLMGFEDHTDKWDTPYK